MTIAEVPVVDEAGRTTYRLDLEYDGTCFKGWQWQPGERTVQKEIERSVRELFGESVPVIGAGRTDAGVHARGQVAHFRVLRHRSSETVKRALNVKLPDDIRVTGVTVASPDFHARFSARWREYRYRIARRPVALGRYYCWVCPYPLDLQRTQTAALMITGEHSFRGFAHSRPEEVHYLSTVYRAEWRESSGFLDFHIEANRFLHGMVRFLVGTFVDIGRGKVDPNQMRDMLASGNVLQSGPKAPSCGLTLMTVGYQPWQDR